MVYCVPTDVRNVLAPGGATSGTNTAADLSDSQLADIITDADRIVDGYVGGTYEGAGPIPDAVRNWSRDMASFLATLTYRRSKDISADDPIRLRYTLVMAQLNGIQKGIVIPPPIAADTLDNDTATVTNMYSGNLFNTSDFNIGQQFDIPAGGG